MDEYNPDIITVVDDDGVEHEFEELDRIETDDGKRYIAMIPSFSEDMLDESGELIILRVIEENGETTHYMTLKEAIEVASDESPLIASKITLLGNLSQEGAIKISKTQNIVIDMNGKTNANIDIVNMVIRQMVNLLHLPNNNL